MLQKLLNEFGKIYWQCTDVAMLKFKSIAFDVHAPGNLRVSLPQISAMNQMMLSRLSKL